LRSIEHLPDVITPDYENDVDEALNVLMKYAKDKVSYRNAEGVVPKKVYYPPPKKILTSRPNGIYHLVRGENSQPVEISYLYPVFMSRYQT
jgi:hypothetical protein